ncbi:glycosyltransferase [candidate division KSB1 bacterium]|nr:glycosyltransferase [candidate division KSB1 bacterium]NIR73262.1 glycosyltransferase [candidate division KSB1 bacterium]NIS26968.1 glycosyltransferase [candidate division KSB1 bacterium]NIT73807.1 glycosyltransferase [candidate division KSB1 bacterium]NIU27712.1 glycosyltransferase [candidate division KSB1 bacterium]
MAFLIFGLWRLKQNQVEGTPKVSVVVAARNEEQNLRRCLEALTHQSYPRERLQLIVVDDRSQDGTREILNHYRSKLPELLKTIRIAENETHPSSKKHALTRGIARATGEFIFTTDADCTPPSAWISEMASLFAPEIGIVIGPAPITAKNELWDKLMGLNTLAKEFVAAGAAGWNLGVTCTGRNLAYRKAVFHEVGGFNNIAHSLSGDDDLFLQEVTGATRWRVTYSLNPNTAVPSQAKKNLSSFVTQHRRHASAGQYYTKPIQASYLVFNIANLSLFVFFAFGLFYDDLFPLAMLTFGLKLILDFLALYLIAKNLRKETLLVVFPLWEIFFLLSQIFISPLGFVGKSRWK